MAIAAQTTRQRQQQSSAKAADDSIPKSRLYFRGDPRKCRDRRHMSSVVAIALCNFAFLDFSKIRDLFRQSDALRRAIQCDCQDESSLLCHRLRPVHQRPASFSYLPLTSGRPLRTSYQSFPVTTNTSARHRHDCSNNLDEEMAPPAGYQSGYEGYTVAQTLQRCVQRSA